MTAPRADHARSERPDWRIIRHVIGIHCGAVVAIDRAAIHQQVPAAVRSDMAERHRLECLDIPGGHPAHSLDNRHDVHRNGFRGSQVTEF